MATQQDKELRRKILEDWERFRQQGKESDDAFRIACHQNGITRGNYSKIAAAVRVELAEQQAMTGQPESSCTTEEFPATTGHNNGTQGTLFEDNSWSSRGF